MYSAYVNVLSVREGDLKLALTPIMRTGQEKSITAGAVVFIRGRVTLIQVQDEGMLVDV